MLPREIPGTKANPGRGVMYIESADLSTFERDYWEQPFNPLDISILETGGMLNHGVELALPGGAKLFAISYKGDLKGHHARVVRQCKELGLRWATIVNGDTLKLSDNTTYPLSECKATFWYAK